MNTHITFANVAHSENITTGRASVFNAHPAHDGELQFFLYFTIVMDDVYDLHFDEVRATPFFKEKDPLSADKAQRIERAGTYVCPYQMKAAMEMILEHLESGETIRLENGMLMCEDYSTMKWL